MVKKITRIFGYSLGSILLIILLLSIAWNQSDIPVAELEKKYFVPGSSYLAIGPDKIHVRQQGAGHPVFLLHGSFASLHTWHAWEKELSQHYHTISLDFPGHGLTGPSASARYSTDDYEKLVFEIADQLNIDSFYVAGNSMGGLVAWKMALHNPGRVKKLILVDAAGFWKISSDSVSKAQSRPFIFKLLQNDWVAKAVVKITPKFLFRYNLKQVYGDPAKVKEEDVDRFYDLMMRAGNRLATTQRLRQPGKNLQDSIRSIKVPTLIMWGEKDAWIPVINAYQFKDAISNSKLLIFDGAGHVPMEEIPEQSVREALSFLQQKPW